VDLRIKMHTQIGICSLGFGHMYVQIIEPHANRVCMLTRTYDHVTIALADDRTTRVDKFCRIGSITLSIKMQEPEA